MRNKNGQEEIVGFGIILIVIAVIALIFISLTLNKTGKAEVEDFESSSFLKALMEKTTSCEKNANLVAIKDLVFECGREYMCSNGEYSCDVLNETLEQSLHENWRVGSQNPIKGYSLKVNYEGDIYFNMLEGNITSEYKGSMQNYSKVNENIEIYFKVYY